MLASSQRTPVHLTIHVAFRQACGEHVMIMVDNAPRVLGTAGIRIVILLSEAVIGVSHL